jgi:aryl carrier-like protein
MQLNRIKTAFSELKKKHDEKKSALTTTKQQQLRELWGQILDIEPVTITMDDSFFRLGGDSIMAMKLVSVARHSGFVLSMADVFRCMRLGEMAAVMKDASQSTTSTATLYSAFSLLGLTDTENFIVEQIRPALSNPTWKIDDVLPTTDNQSRDVKATVDIPRSSVQYNILYLDRSIDLDRLLLGCMSVVARHAILRTVFVAHGNSYLQVVLEGLDVPTEYHETGDNVVDFCHKVCAADIDTEFQLGATFLRFFFITGKQGKAFIFRISHAQYDGVSLPELIKHFNLAYKGDPITSTPSFASYLSHVKELKTRSIEYWKRLLADSSVTKLQPPLLTLNSTKSIFITSCFNVTPKCGDATMATILTAAWAIVLSKLVSTRDVVFGGVSAGRSVDLPNVGKIIGPCYQYIPIRVKFDPAWTITDLLTFVQDQNINSMPFESLGFEDIVKNCTRWSTDTEFDSIVHYQNIEDFDEMPFGQTTCRVDIARPHTEDGAQWKIVSFPKNGKMNIGILAGEALQGSALLRLNELVKVIDTFVEHPDWKPFSA